MSHPATVKALSPGRVIVVNSFPHENVLGVILKTSTTIRNERLFTIMVICEKEMKTSNEHGEGAHVVKPVIKCKLFQPEGPCWHAVIQCKGDDIDVVTTKTLRVDSDRILTDVKKREQSRFRYEVLPTFLDIINPLPYNPWQNKNF